jgi:hypothetical protein
MTVKDFDGVEDAVKEELDKLTLDNANQSRAQIALALARTLDDARDSNSGAMAQSVPGTSKELRETMKEIRESIIDGDAFLGGLLTPDE